MRDIVSHCDRKILHSILDGAVLRVLLDFNQQSKRSNHFLLTRVAIFVSTLIGRVFSSLIIKLKEDIKGSLGQKKTTKNKMPLPCMDFELDICILFRLELMYAKILSHKHH